MNYPETGTYFGGSDYYSHVNEVREKVKCPVENGQENATGTSQKRISPELIPSHQQWEKCKSRS